MASESAENQGESAGDDQKHQGLYPLHPLRTCNKGALKERSTFAVRTLGEHFKAATLIWCGFKIR